MKRHIPATMATQHPDNAGAPYWEKDGDGFISTQEEVAECFSAWHDLDCQEFMWDWEGKHVDEGIIDKLFHNHYAYFKKEQLGRNRFLTFRIPNTWHERGYSLARAFMGILTAARFARDLNLHTPPLFEVILPLTEKAENIITVQKMFSRLANFTNKLFHEPGALNYLNVLPLLEGIDTLTSSHQLLTRYLKLHQKTYHSKPSYLRPHIARSDPALAAGLIPAVVAGKLALSEYYRFGREHNIKIYPAIGVGLLPFRGGLSPQSLDNFFHEYGGIRTVYIQSAFRYDFPLPTVKQAIRKLNQRLPQTKAHPYSPAAAREITLICQKLAPIYRRSVARLADTINELAKFVPARRERKLHIGLLGYSRELGRKRLPRAIPFTAVLYSLGIPPEFIGSGRGLKLLVSKNIKVEKYYLNIRQDLELAGQYLNKGNLFTLAKSSRVWQDIWDDVTLVEKYFNLNLGPRHKPDLAHNQLSYEMLLAWRKRQNLTSYITESAKLRHSLG
ncbi:MAG: phosphoenolpyruvate carboxylase [Candidatus Kerfeldbacteria bacterium]|nr:phosphoenolpyruvate carboxylase [Candidatus Kerfeldbacteria bacterium]